VKKRTIGVAVVGAVVVVILGVGIQLSGNFGQKRGKIVIAERLLTVMYHPGGLVTFMGAKVTQDGDDRFTVEGDTLALNHVTVQFEKKDGKWRIKSVYGSNYRSTWERIKRHAYSFLP